MKAKHLLLLPPMLILTVFVAIAQGDGDNHHSVKHTPFGRKLPPPDITNHVNDMSQVFSTTDIRKSDAPGKGPEHIRQILADRRQSQTALSPNIIAGTKSGNIKKPASNNSSCNFHLVKDINALSESNPHNYSDYHIDINYNFFVGDSISFAVLDNVIYFVADDGIHGQELWRSDGTAEGTFLLKDIVPDAASSGISNITAVNGKIYFSAIGQLWVSDGTEGGTQSLDVSNPMEYFSIDNKTYFTADGDSYLSAIWTSDGTIAGTTPVLDLVNIGSGGEEVRQVTLVEGLLFFTFYDYDTNGWQIGRSDFTEAGTYHVGTSYPFIDPITDDVSNFIPAQLTSYKHKLYFSANEGTGRKLWVSDGTDAGTTLAPGNNNVLIDADFLGTSFPIVNNILCVPGDKTTIGNSLFKYNSDDNAGLVKIKDFSVLGGNSFIVSKQMQVANNTLYFKVASAIGGGHDELWSSKGTKASTRLVYKSLKGETISNLYNANGSLYFVKDDRFLGSELWRVFETYFGSFPIITSDIFKGRPGSHPSHLTAFKEKLVFSAVDEKKGNELFITNKFGFGAALVKDINSVTTATSLAGYNPNVFNLGNVSMIALGNDLLFTAYTRTHGNELYRSDGTASGTQLLNDIIPGDAGFNALTFLSKNNAAYFIAISDGSSSIYVTKGTKNSLRKITPDYPNITTFSVADNGLVFYQVYNQDKALYELWRSDGTPGGTYLLSSTLYYSSYLNVSRNTAFFVAGDAAHGYELWKSDGSVAGTKLVKDINPGTNSSVPGGMFIYKNEVYFSAEDGTSSYPSFWKSNGTSDGTIKLANIDPWWGRSVAATLQCFGISKNILYFTAINHNDLNGTQLWRTDGTIAGTKVVKDINPYDGSANGPSPKNLTDVNGTLFFTANDGVNGYELWKTDGTDDGTRLVKDLSTGDASTSFYKFVSFGEKIFFTAIANGNQRIWYSDGTEDGTKEVLDPEISDVRIIDIYHAGNYLFSPGYTAKLGLELYAGKVCEASGKFVVEKATVTDETIRPFNAVLYPNPTESNATIQVTGDTKNDVSVIISDMSGKKLWQTNHSINENGIFISLPIEKYVAGIYIVKVTSGTESETFNLVKQ